MRLKIFGVLAGLILLSFGAAALFASSVAADAASVGQAMAEVQRGLLIWLGVALIGAALLAGAGYALLTPGVQRLLAAAQRIEQGDRDVRNPLPDSGPLTALGMSLQRIAAHQARSIAELRSERDLVGRILARMDEGVMVLDSSRRVSLVNAALRSMLLPEPTVARTAAQTPPRTATGEVPSALDVRGKTVLEVFRHAELEGLLDAANGEAGRSSGEIEVGGIMPRRLLVRAARFQGDGGYLLVFLDVTDVRKLESLRRDFVANVSHELRTPVAAVRSAAETLRMVGDGDPAARVRFVDIVERNAERLQNLIEDLLDLSRIESRAYKLNIEPVELHKVAAYVLGLFRDRAEARRISLTNEVPQDLPIVHSDRRALEQVLCNLVDNAVKYCHAGSAISLRARTDGSHVRVTVADTGAGIEPQHLTRLFERFYRVDPGRSRDHGGTGLGLSIVKHLAEAMGGQVAVESRIGQGSSFTVTLPVRHSAPRVT